MRVVENYKNKTFTIYNINRFQKITFLAVKLIDTLEIEDLRINFANKKIYQLIN